MIGFVYFMAAMAIPLWMITAGYFWWQSRRYAARVKKLEAERYGGPDLFAGSHMECDDFPLIEEMQPRLRFRVGPIIVENGRPHLPGNLVFGPGGEMCECEICLEAFSQLDRENFQA